MACPPPVLWLLQGKLPFTGYMGSFTKRSIFQMGLGKEGGVTHSHFSGRVNFPFGFGLSYTTFAYSLDSASRHVVIAAHGGAVAARLAVTVRNTGPRRGDAIVLAFLRFAEPPPGTPRQRLVGFDRVGLEVGERAVVRFQMTARQLSVVDDATGERRPLPPGRYAFAMGDVVDPAVATIELV